MIFKTCVTCGRYDCAEFLCGTEFDVPDYIRNAPDYGGPTYEESVEAYTQSEVAIHGREVISDVAGPPDSGDSG